MPTYLDIYIDQNASFNNTINLVDRFENPINLTNYIVISELKTSYISKTAVASFYTTIANNAYGSITLSLPYQTTSNLKSTRHVYDVLLLDTTANTVTRALEGTAYVGAGVTCPNANNAFANTTLNTSQSAYTLLNNVATLAQAAFDKANTGVTMLRTTRTISSNTTANTALLTDSVIFVNKTFGGPIIINLPANTPAGFLLTIKDTKGDCSTNNITLTANGNFIEGSNTFIMSVNRMSLDIISDAINWNLI